MPKQRKNVILVFLILLTSIGVLCIAIVTVMLLGEISSTRLQRYVLSTMLVALAAVFAGEPLPVAWSTK